MVLYAAFGCKNRSDRVKEPRLEKLSYFRFPKDENRKKAWITATRLLNWEPNKNSVLCSEHFEDKYVDRSSLFSVRLEKNAIPTIFHGFPSHLQKKKSTRKPPVCRALISTPNNLPAEENFAETSQNLAVKNLSPISTQSAESFLSTSCQSSSVDEDSGKFSAESVSSCTLNMTGEEFSSITYPDTPRKIYLKEKISNLKMSIKKQKKILQQKNRRQSKKIADLKSVIATLRDYISDEKIEKLRSIGGPNDEFLKRFFCKSVGKPCPNKYGSDIRAFALTLHYYSPRAYNYVRNRFKSCLPHPKTISKWYQCVGGEPGFSTEAFASIKARACLSTHLINCSLIFDEMAIRRLIEYDGNKYYGYVDMGTGAESEEEAKEVLVFMLVAINGKWKIPVGYFLSNGVSGEEKSSLVKQCLILAHEAGVRVTSLTFDGASSNFTMCNYLGCNLNINALKPYFSHPITNESVYIFPDPSHMLKLIRNTFCDKKILIDYDGNAIEWKYLESLHNLQEGEGLHLGNKLKGLHLSFRKQIMKVKLAAQLFSASIADSLKFCKDVIQLQQFESCQPTIDFVILINDIFDCLNTRSTFNSVPCKKAINSVNFDKILDFASKAKNYLLQLKFDSSYPVKLVESNRKVGFLGFVICLETLMLLSKELLKCPSPFIYLPTYKLSQDHLELFFGTIRSHGGCNNNPSAKQFRAAYKKCVVHTDLRESGSGNCIPIQNIKILHYSSGEPEKELNRSSQRSSLTEESNMSFNNTLMSVIDDHSYVIDNSLSECTINIVGHISGFVIRYLYKVIVCEECLNALTVDKKSDSPYGLINTKSKGGLIYPSHDVVNICKLTEKIIRQCLNENGGKFLSKKYNTDVLTNLVMRTINYSNLFDALIEHINDQSPLDNHIGLLTRTIARKYVDIRLHYIARKHVDSSHSVRNSFNRLVLFRGH